MAVSRFIEKTVKFTLDECIPPILRDSRIFMTLLLKLVFKGKARHYLNFKENIPLMSKSELQFIYADTSSVKCSAKTDLSQKIMETIISEIYGGKVLDAGCGKGFLANRLDLYFNVTACDIHIGKKVHSNNVKFTTADIHKLPYQDSSFDTVISTHCIEHVLDISAAVNELRRVSKKRLIIVVPKERPYQYSFNFHLHFFPYQYSIIQLFNANKSALNYSVQEIDGCWYYREDVK